MRADLIFKKLKLY